MSITAQSDSSVYLDYSATTPLDPRVLKAMMPYFDKRYGNPSSLYASGRRAMHAIKEAKSVVAKVLECSAEEIIFTGSGTESDNLALLGVARANKANGRHIIISSIEHKAVFESAHLLEREGFEVSVAPVLSNGIIDTKRLSEMLRDDTVLVSVMYANNEIGTVEPIREISKLIQTFRGGKQFPLLHTDACQAPGFLSLSVLETGVDLMTLNGSKMYGPKGIGFLYKKSGVRIEPIIVGGGQEGGVRAGTQSVPFIVGCAEALRIADLMRDKESARLAKLRDYFIASVKKEIPEAILNGHPIKRLPGNVHFSFPNIEGESILLMLDSMGVEVATGSACSARDLRPSHVLLAIGQSAELAHGSIRFSFGRYTTLKKLKYVLGVLPEIIKKLRSLSALEICL